MSQHDPVCGYGQMVRPLFGGVLAFCVCTGALADAHNERQPAVAKKPAADHATPQRHAVFSKPVPENIADLLAIEKRVKRLVKQVLRSTVGVRIGRAQGSGVIVSKEGYVLTAAHVAGKPGRAVTLLLADGRRVHAKSLGLDRTVDAALLKITDEGEWPYAPMGDVEELKVGDWCIATGHPGGYQKGRSPVVRVGRVVLVRDALVQSDCTLVGGDSGGPLFDTQGRVIGIHSRIGAPTSWNFHVPISAFSKNWDRLAAAEEWGGRPGAGGAILGVSGTDAQNGAKLTQIAPGLPAKKAGLLVGDVIVKFDGQPVKNFDALAAAVRRKKPGDRVAIEIVRRDRILRKTVVLAERR